MSAAKTPGQVAFEKWWSTSSRPRQWEALNHFHQADWEGVAEAVIRMCASVIRDRWEENITKGDDVMRVREDTQCELAILSLIPAKNGGEG